MDGDTLARLAYLGVLIVAVGGYLLVEDRAGLGRPRAGSWLGG